MLNLFNYLSYKDWTFTPIFNLSICVKNELIENNVKYENQIYNLT